MDLYTLYFASLSLLEIMEIYYFLKLMLISNCSVLIILPKSCALIGYTSYHSPVPLATFMDNMIIDN